MDQTPRSRSWVKNNGTHGKVLSQRNIHMKYQSSNTHCSKVISKVKVSERRTEWQNDRQNKNNMPPDLRSRGHKNLCNISDVFTERSRKWERDVGSLEENLECWSKWRVLRHNRRRSLLMTDISNRPIIKAALQVTSR